MSFENFFGEAEFNYELEKEVHRQYGFLERDVGSRIYIMEEVGRV